MKVVDEESTPRKKTMLQEQDTPAIAEFVGNLPVSWLCEKAGISVDELCTRISRVRPVPEPALPGGGVVVTSYGGGGSGGGGARDLLPSGNGNKKKSKAKKTKSKATQQPKAAAAAPATSASKPTSGKPAKKSTNNIGNVRMLSTLPGTLSQISVKLHRNKADCTAALRRMQNEGLVLVDKMGEDLVYRAVDA